MKTFVFDVIIDAVREASEAEIMLGYPLQVAQKCEEDCACYEDQILKPKP